MLNFNIASFLSDHWQQKPCVLRNAIPDFTDLLDEHELAGLAMEPDFDSRIISKQGDDWTIQQGPFTEFSACQGHWTLLVQGVDKYIEEASNLMAQFNFIPNWRVDDLMISFAVPGAGVGPHTDQYDVFLLQGKGKRRWRVGHPDGLTAIQPTAGLCQVEGFEPLIDCELNPGDILYIPPGWAHDGVAVEESLTYSVGFRAPDQTQLASYLAEYLQTRHTPSRRYTDAGLLATQQASEVSDEQLKALKAMLHEAIDAPGFEQTLLTLLSEQGLEPLGDDEITSDILRDILDNQGLIYRAAGCRPLLNRHTPDQLYINGEVVTFNPVNFESMLTLTNKLVVDRTDMANSEDELDIFCTFTKLVRMGYWEVAPD
ncbi:cupin domain-containing protein [Alteromonas lipolytica]|uniref:JmjC domain-containing protein n=1 Tax=Alteromonas lipolytica TaxID=1856405 RepID=A0A1E8FGC9_9ALTE|nr:cupin domain-containing protein [Alteromonas lipolytica]OFI34974.1 hypothetical protein BFC17_15540 [Alteromonas lipolytica]GGF55544.1 50S ribosomal protein L16 arginine hydroxylase [Alteromonas lipolytica]